MQISNIYKIYKKHPSVSTDSRKINKGDLFFALKGDNFDGNKYINKAISLGASYAITDDVENKNIPNCIYVKNSLVTLQELAKYHREELNIPIIAITGTNGKTTTKELITTVLKQKYNVGSTNGNFNNHIGVPLTLLSFNKKTEIGIVEMGANHQKEIEFLCNIAKPNFGIITNIGKAHLEGFGNFENLIKTKAELYTSINKNKGKIFINDDNTLLKSLIKEQDIITYGEKSNTFCRGQFLSSNPFVKFKIDKNITINSNLIGKYNFENLLAASCIAKFFKVEVPKIKKAVEDYIPTNNRSQIIKVNSCNIILDAYNANPTSMALAIENFENIKAKNKVIILGDMFELGDFADKEHNKVINQILNLKNNNKIETFIIGNTFNKLNIKNPLISFETTSGFIKYISKKEFNNTWFLIKGSRGMKLESIIKHLNLS